MKHKYFEKNVAGRDFVVGDIHGCYDILFKHLDELRFNYDTDRLFSVGDVVDRGKRSMDCLKLIHEPWFHMVIGNHEEMMLDAILGDGATYVWSINGGEWHVKEDATELTKLCEEVEELPISMTIKTEKGDVGICHAQPPLKHREETVPWEHAQHPTISDQKGMLWGRDIIKRAITVDGYEVFVEGVHKVYCGHSVVPNPKTVGNIEFIDTGCVYVNLDFVGRLTVKELV